MLNLFASISTWFIERKQNRQAKEQEKIILLLKQAMLQVRIMLIQDIGIENMERAIQSIKKERIAGFYDYLTLAELIGRAKLQQALDGEPHNLHEIELETKSIRQWLEKPDEQLHIHPSQSIPTMLNKSQARRILQLPY